MGPQDRRSSGPSSKKTTHSLPPPVFAARKNVFPRMSLLGFSVNKSLMRVYC